MPPRKLPDPRDDVQVSRVLRDEGADPMSVPLPDEAGIDHVRAGHEGQSRHANVELESGPVDREGRDDPLPEAP